MKAMHTTQSFELQPGETILLKCHQRQMLAVQAADSTSIWMTRIGDCQDYWLGAGDVVELRAGDDVLLGLEATAAVARIAIVAGAHASLRACIAIACADILAKISARLCRAPARTMPVQPHCGTCSSV